ncbi:ImmA/IrrE family metallo-endopeptidase [Mycolicibacterium pyrenivorans]|uniref:ImmA/IrrE family metallo-endopeptidase n=1 Tax=Mycolicibacterium pyrenivorans TaxID=187102 RepID=UPI0021F2DBF0|nr:ImmA/IrrE family metallo-endopeptidase [Mycolicibacterium pyrenivorans]MCV7154340.1 ImmA/IrrE family metallo-endopeptidase [Mycolicibacterium pyrenivorans]
MAIKLGLQVKAALPVGGACADLSDTGGTIEAELGRWFAVALVVDRAKSDAEATARDFSKPGLFPVNVEGVAERMGVRIEFAYLRDGVSGMIRSRPPEVPVIYVDATENEARQRFTIAHELGHYVERINQGQEDFAFIDERGTKYDLHEFYADEFAGNLLMPADEIARMQRRGMTNLELAAYFGVSPAALNMRLKRLARRQ